MKKIVASRRICWPDFDQVCAQGGCGHCRDNAFRPVIVIQEKARALGLEKAFIQGLEMGWAGVETKAYFFHDDGQIMVDGKPVSGLHPDDFLSK